MNERRPPVLERPVMREQFRKELRGRLMSEAVVVLAPRPSWFSFPAILRPALAVAAILVLVLAGATNAAASSLPGDALYGVKRTTELAQVANQRPSSAPTATQEYADAVERFANALDDLRNADNEDNRNAAQTLAEAAQAKHKAVLDAVKDRLPAGEQPEVQKVIDREEQRTSPSDNSGRPGRPSNVPAKPTPKK
jgi:hypothetical protein